MAKMTIKPLLKLVIRPFLWIYFYLLKGYYTWLLERLVKKANRLSKEENRKYIVTRMAGKPMLFTKQNLKQSVARRKFKKGVTIETIENHAYYVTSPGKSKTPVPEKVGIKK